MKKTMKRHSFTSQLASLALVFGITLVFASCANENVAQNLTNTDEDNDKNLTTFVAGDEAKTRTSMEYYSGNFYWEAGDYIYVKDDNNVWQRSSNAPTEKVSFFKFKVPGKFTASSNYKVYYLGKNNTNKRVVISTIQKQTAPGNTEHFGESGDYGTAIANKITGKQQFNFELEHQPAYLVFQPHTYNAILRRCYLTKIEVTSDNDIAEGYTINPSTDNLDGSSIGKQIVLTTKSSSGVYTNGFPLAGSGAGDDRAYMIIKPGTHALMVRYWVRDLVTHVEGTITKLLPSSNYASNTYYDMTAELDVKNYSEDQYYMWDAENEYWEGHISDRPLGNGQSNSNYPKSGDNRYCNTTYPGFGVSNPAINTPCKDLPNVNEMCWYAAKGNPFFDQKELWTTYGRLYKGGMWFKKKAYISNFRDDQAPDGNDWRTLSKSDSWSASGGHPDIADANKYFFLPCIGFFDRGELKYVGGDGFYWLSSADPLSSFSAYCVRLGSSVRVGTDDREYGYRIGTFE